jgi:hypothetical protein
MRVVERLYILLGVFVLAAGAVYGVWGHEPAGTLYLVVLGVAFAYLARESGEYGDEPADVEDGLEDVDVGHGGGGPGSPAVPEAQHVSFHASAPSITPFFFAIGAGLILTGLVFATWLVFLGGATVALVAVVWFVETGRRRAAEEAAHAAHAAGGHQDAAGA